MFLFTRRNARLEVRLMFDVYLNSTRCLSPALFGLVTE